MTSKLQIFGIYLKNTQIKKHIEMAAEKFVDLLADYGVSDLTFKEVTGADKYLDGAINYYLDLHNDDDEEYEDD